MTNKIDMKKIVVGTLLGSGSLVLGSWNAQAHGNRSSHSSPWAAVEMPGMPADILSPYGKDVDPDSPQWKELENIKEQIASAPNDIRWRMEYDTLQTELKYKPLTSSVVAMVRLDDMPSAMAMIDSSSTTYEKYITMSSVLANLKREGEVSGLTTNQNIGVIYPLAKQFYDDISITLDGLNRGDKLVAQNVLDGVSPDIIREGGVPFPADDIPKAKAIVAVALHNIGSSLQYDREVEPTSIDQGDLYELGLAALDNSLQLHNQTGHDQHGSLWAMGNLFLNNGDLIQAEEYFRQSLDHGIQADSGNEAIAWSKAFLALTLEQKGEAFTDEAGALKFEAREHIRGAETSNARYLMKILDASTT